METTSSRQHQHDTNRQTSDMHQHGVPVVGWVGQEWSDGLGFAVAGPDQDGEHHKAPQQLERWLEGLIKSERIEGSQALGKVLDLSRDHRADSKDTAHAQRPAEIPHGKRPIPHGINAPGAWATHGGGPSSESLTALRCLEA